MTDLDINPRLGAIEVAAQAMMNGDDAAAIQWLNTPNPMFGNETPVEHAATEVGMLEVEDLIGRIRNGVFS